MIPTSIARDQQIADQLERYSSEMEKSIQDVGQRVRCLQVLKLLLTTLGEGYSFTFESTGKVKVDRFVYCQRDNSFNTMINVLQAYLTDDELILENMHSNHPRRVFSTADMEHGGMSILLAVKDFEINSAFSYADNQRERLIEKIGATEARITVLESRLMATSDFLSGRRY